MFTLSSDLKFQLYGQATDMRKSFDGLCGLVKNNLGESPLNGDVYVFINKNRNKIKLLHWKGKVDLFCIIKGLKKALLNIPDMI